MKMLANILFSVCSLMLFGCTLGQSGSSVDGAGSGSSLASASGGAAIGIGSGGSSSAVARGGSGSSTSSIDCTLAEDRTGCVGESFEGEGIPLDIYIMFDQSGSMCSCINPTAVLCDDPSCKQTRIDAVRSAAEQFLRDPKSAGIGVGIGYFGKQPIGQAICETNEYSRPAVTIGKLPAQADAIVRSLNSVTPTGETPTSAAIRGACSYATGWKQETPSHEVVVLLLTDGKPEAPVSCANPGSSCCPTLDQAVTAASECLHGNPGIKTYVLGVGPLLQNLEQIAVAGGTERAYLVEGGDVSQEVLNALNRIRGDASIPCQFSLPKAPSGQRLLYDHVNIKYADAACNSTLFLYVENQQRCGPDGGWYYDDPQNPQSIQLCPTTCAQVSIPGGKLFYSVGCETQVQLR